MTNHELVSDENTEPQRLRCLSNTNIYATEKVTEVPLASVTSACYCFAHDLIAREHSGRFPEWTSTSLRIKHAQSFSVDYVVDHAPPNTHFLGRHNESLLMSGTNPPHTMEFDSQGELLLTSSDSACVLIHSMECLKESKESKPLLALSAGYPVTRARWNKGNENIMGVTKRVERSLSLYDINYTQGAPTRILHVPHAPSGSTVIGSTAAGLNDLAFLTKHHGYAIAAASQGGQVLLWDTRENASTPCIALQTMPRSSITSLQPASDDQLIVAGTRDGGILIWDMRYSGGGGGKAAAIHHFGGKLHHTHAVLSEIALHERLAHVPGLLLQTNIRESGVKSMQLNPHDETRLAFHLTSTWSGVLDLKTFTITHLHAPNPTVMRVGGDSEATVFSQQVLDEEEEEEEVLTVQLAEKRQGQWMSQNDLYCIPSATTPDLLFLDFSTSKSSGGRVDDGDGKDAGERRRRLPSAVRVSAGQRVYCVAPHPSQEYIIAGGDRGLSLLST